MTPLTIFQQAASIIAPTTAMLARAQSTIQSSFSDGGGGGW